MMDVVWLIEQRVLLVRIGCHVTLAELDHQIGLTLNRGASSAVHVVIQDRELLPVFHDFDEIALFDHPRIGWIVVYGVQNRLLRYIWSVASQQRGLRVCHVDSQAQALQFLSETDPTLAVAVV